MIPVVVVPADALATWSPPGGWVRREGFELPARPWDLRDRCWVCVGSVADGEEAAAALGAGVRGTGLALAVELGGTARLRFLEDLAKLHPGADASLRPPAAPTGPGPADLGLSELERRLLELVARGSTLSAAATETHVSRRTAHRAMARARTLLGATTTAAAATRWAALEPPSDDR